MKRSQLVALFAVAFFATLLPTADALVPVEVVPREDFHTASSGEPRVMTSEEFAREILRDLPAVAREFGVELSDVEMDRPGKLRVVVVSCDIHEGAVDWESNEDEKRILEFIAKYAQDRADVVVLNADSEGFYQKPTSTNIRAYLRMLSVGANPNDDILVAVIGNGVSVDDKDYFIPDDGSFINSANWVGFREIESSLQESSARRTTILWDANRLKTRVEVPASSHVVVEEDVEFDDLASIDAVERVARRSLPLGNGSARVRRVFFVCAREKYGMIDEQGGDRGLQALLSEATSVDDFFGDSLDALKERAQRRLDEGKVGQTLEVEGF